MDGRAKEGVGIVTSEQWEPKVSGWKAVNSRIITLRLELEIAVTFIQVYAPTENSTVLETEEFYAELQRTIDGEEVEGRQILLAGDFNARTGWNKRIAHGCIGNFGGERILNENGRRLIEFCIKNQLIIGNSLFRHKEVHKITFEGEGRNTKSIIDYFIYPNTIRRYIMDVKVIRGAELTTDHRLIVANARYQKPRKTRIKKIKIIKTKELQKEEKRKEYQELIKSKLHIEDEGDERQDLDSMWS